MALALECAPRFLGSGFGVAAHAGDRDGVQGPVQRTVSAAIEAVPASLSATGLKGCDSGQGGERCFASDPAGVRPADQHLGGHYWSDARFGQ